jgi:hypothetical protein
MYGENRFSKLPAVSSWRYFQFSKFSRPFNPVTATQRAQPARLLLKAKLKARQSRAKLVQYNTVPVRNTVNKDSKVYNAVYSVYGRSTPCGCVRLRVLSFPNLIIDIFSPCQRFVWRVHLFKS